MRPVRYWLIAIFQWLIAKLDDAPVVALVVASSAEQLNRARAARLSSMGSNGRRF
jgi:hypothetical protein